MVRKFLALLTALLVPMSMGMVSEDGSTGCDANVEAAPPALFNCLPAPEESEAMGALLSTVEGPSTYSESNDLSWSFDSTITADARTYILNLWSDIRPRLGTILGPPSRNMTVYVSHDPYILAAGQYRSWSDQMVLRYLPRPEDGGLFDEVFTHETVHAYQDAALDRNMDSWCAEGTAVCATSMVREMLAGSRQLFQRWKLDYLSKSYDSFCPMGGDALGGSRYFTDTVSQLFSYPASGGFWWMLTASQAHGTPGVWSNYTYLAAFFRRLHETGRSLASTDVAATIAETAHDPIDGTEAGAWTARQPITNTSGRTGKFIWAAAFNELNGISGLIFQLFNRSRAGGERYALSDYSVPVRVRDSSGNVTWQTVQTAAQQRNGYQYLNLPYLPEGVYRIEIDGTSAGAGSITLTIQQPPDGIYNSEWNEWRAGFCFLDPSTNGLMLPTLSIRGASSIRLRDFSYLARIPNEMRLPFTLTLTPEGEAASRWTVPLPYRRVFRVNKPAPKLVVESTTVDGDLRTGGRGNVTLRVRNDGDATYPIAAFGIRWTDESMNQKMPWGMANCEACEIAPGETVDIGPYYFTIWSGETLLTAQFEISVSGTALAVGSVTANLPPAQALYTSADFLTTAMFDSGRLFFTKYGPAPGLYVDDLATGSIRNLATNPGTLIAVKGDTAVYLKEFGRLVVHNLATDQIETLDTYQSTGHPVGAAAVSDERIAWQVYGLVDYKAHLKILDRGSGVITQIDSTSTYWLGMPIVAGTAVAFLDGFNVRIVDPSHGPERSYPVMGSFDFDGHRLVSKGDGGSLLIRDLDTGSSQTVSAPGYQLWSPQIAGNWCCAVANSNETYRSRAIMVMNLSQLSPAILERPADVQSVTVRQGRVTWIEASGPYSVMQANLGAEVPGVRPRPMPSPAEGLLEEAMER